MKKISVALGDYPHGRALLSGDVPVDGFEVDPVTVNPIIGAYRRMIRVLEFDVCELAPTSYLMARDRGIPLTAIPVFLNRRFHHGDIQCAASSGIAVPADLEGRKIGVRAYSVTTGVWGRGILSEEYGVDTRQVTWVVDDDDHIEGTWPARIERVTDGRSLGALLSAGEIDAAFTGRGSPGRPGRSAATPSLTAEASTRPAWTRSCASPVTRDSSRPTRARSSPKASTRTPSPAPAPLPLTQLREQET